MFLRFVNSRMINGMHAREGFFCAAYDLVNQPDINKQTSRNLENILSWYKANLYVPARFTRSKSKGFYRKDTKGLSWFKPTAKTHLSKAFELSQILGECGYHIDILKSAAPGYIIYEDDHQVIAEPFSDTPV